VRFEGAHVQPAALVGTALAPLVDVMHHPRAGRVLEVGSLDQDYLQGSLMASTWSQDAREPRHRRGTGAVGSLPRCLVDVWAVQRQRRFWRGK
jgi:hypothetical protein